MPAIADIYMCPPAGHWLESAALQLLSAETTPCSLLGVLLRGLERLHANLNAVSRPVDLLVSTKSFPPKLRFGPY